MSLTHLDDRCTEGTPDPAETITVTLGEKTFRTGRRTAAHIEWTIERLERKHPGARLLILQGSYNTTVDASRGTHDGDGVIDVIVVGHDGDETQRFLRDSGWASWHRYPPLFPEHNHAISLGCPGPVGIYVPGQVEDYYAHRSGLAGHVTDPTYHPATQYVFDYPAWIAAKEDEVTPDDIEKIAKRTAEIILDVEKVDGDKKISVRQSLNQTRNDAEKAAAK